MKSRQIPMRDELFETLISKAQQGDKEAKDSLVMNNLSLVWSIVHRFNTPLYDKEDIFQIGCIGLIKAINKFDLNYDVQFSTYAVPIIIGEIKRYFRDDGAIKVSRSLKELNVKINQISEKYLSEYQRPITINELSNILKVPTSEIVLAMDSKYYPTSLSEPIYEKDGSTICIEDRIEDVSNYSFIDKITLQESIKKLDKKEQLLIQLRYYKDMNQDQIAKVFNVSQVQISRMEKKIIEKLKKQFI